MADLLHKFAGEEPCAGHHGLLFGLCGALHSCVLRGSVSQAGHVWLVQSGCTAVVPDAGGSPAGPIWARLCLPGLRMCNDNSVVCMHAAQHSEK